MNSISSQKGLSWSYTHLASGKRINTAKDDAAGMAIAKRMQSQETGLRVGADNAGMAMGALNVEEGAMGGISDY